MQKVKSNEIFLSWIQNHIIVNHAFAWEVAYESYTRQTVSFLSLDFIILCLTRTSTPLPTSFLICSDKIPSPKIPCLPTFFCLYCTSQWPPQVRDMQSWTLILVANNKFYLQVSGKCQFSRDPRDLQLILFFYIAQQAVRQMLCPKTKR